MNAISDTIIRRIRGKGRGWVFTPKDFLDVATRASIYRSLSCLACKGTIRRLDRGIYDFPQTHPKIGVLSPDVALLAKAIAARRGDIIFPSGAMSANYLHLSTQVPAKTVYMTSGASKTRIIDGRTIIFRHARVPILDYVSFNVNSVLQALYYFGKSNIDDKIIRQCANVLSEQDVMDLSAAASLVPAWLAEIILKIKHKKFSELSET